MAPTENPISSEIRADGSHHRASKEHRSRDAPRRIRSPPVFLFLPVSVAALGVSLLFLSIRMAPRQSFRTLAQDQIMHDHYRYYHGVLDVESNKTESDEGGGGNGTEPTDTKARQDTENDERDSGSSDVPSTSKPDIKATDAVLETSEKNHGGEQNVTESSNAIHDDASNRSSDETIARLKKIIQRSTDSFESRNTTSTDLGTEEPSRLRLPDAITDDSGNLVIEFFDKNRQRNEGMAACLINLEDTIRMAEWLPYHYATLPLGGLVIALDPQNSERGIQRTLQLIDLWKDKIDITLWPGFFIPERKQYRTKQAYTRQRQVYFANRCLMYHRKQNRSWTLLTDNDEYVIFNYVHDDESLEYDHPGAGSKKVMKVIEKNREKYMPLRKDLPPQNQTTVLDYIRKQQGKMRKKDRFLPRCVRLPGIHYGGNHGLNETLVGEEIIEPRFLTTLREIHYNKRSSRFSKVMIDLSNVSHKDLKWKESYKGNTIHNPSKKICGFNGNSESGADYPSSLFRLNHYLGNLESYLERSADYRGRGVDKYDKKMRKVNTTGDHKDTDIFSWIDVFVRSVGGTDEARRLLEPLVAYQQEGAAARSVPNATAG